MRLITERSITDHRQGEYSMTITEGPVVSISFLSLLRTKVDGYRLVRVSLCTMRLWRAMERWMVGRVLDVVILKDLILGRGLG